MTNKNRKVWKMVSRKSLFGKQTPPKRLVVAQSPKTLYPRASMARTSLTLVSELFFDLVSLSGSNLIEEIFIDKGDKT
jgi:hypothetical protein